MGGMMIFDGRDFRRADMWVARMAHRVRGSGRSGCPGVRGNVPRPKNPGVPIEIMVPRGMYGRRRPGRAPAPTAATGRISRRGRGDRGGYRAW